MAKNMLLERRGIAEAQQRGIYILGWASLIIAVVGGAFAAESWIGDMLAAVLGWFPASWELPNLLLFIGFIAFAIDLIVDMTPNRPALFFVIGAPTVATAGDGKMADFVSEQSNAMQGWIGGELSAWVGSGSASVLAIIAVVTSLLMARRVLDKQRSGRMG